MKSYLKNFALAIPLALGVVFTILCVVNAMEAANDADNGVVALIFGVIGIPLLFASSVALSKPQNA